MESKNRKYKYTGSEPVSVAGVGYIEPNSTFETTIEINNPNFHEVGKSKEETETVKGEVKNTSMPDNSRRVNNGNITVGNNNKTI